MAVRIVWLQLKKHGEPLLTFATDDMVAKMSSSFFHWSIKQSTRLRASESAGAVTAYRIIRTHVGKYTRSPYARCASMCADNTQVYCFVKQCVSLLCTSKCRRKQQAFSIFREHKFDAQSRDVRHNVTYCMTRCVMSWRKAASMLLLQKHSGV